MLYHAYEVAHAAISPWRHAARLGRDALENRLNPLAHTPAGRMGAAACRMFADATRRYGKPDFAIADVATERGDLRVAEDVIARTPFCELRRFRKVGALAGRAGPKLLIVAPMSGHHATLLRGTVEAFLPGHDVHITDWRDARTVPLAVGRFDLDDYIDHLIGFFRALGPDLHVVAVCQPAVPALAACALMAGDGEACQPASLTLMGGPIDTRINPTVPNRIATERPLSWFEHNVITHVPWPHMGFMRAVYPGFLQLAGFMAMNIDRHVGAHARQFNHLVAGDGDSAAQHRKFYDEFMSVMDLTAEFYLQTIDVVFQRQALARGEMASRGRPVRPELIRDTALFTIEGERDDISALGQTEAAHRLCAAIPDERRAHYVQAGVGHYGVFNGRRFREEIAPRIAGFIAAHRGSADALAA